MSNRVCRYSVLPLQRSQKQEVDMNRPLIPMSQTAAGFVKCCRPYQAALSICYHCLGIAGACRGFCNGKHGRVASSIRTLMVRRYGRSHYSVSHCWPRSQRYRFRALTFLPAPTFVLPPALARSPVRMPGK